MGPTTCASGHRQSAPGRGMVEDGIAAGGTLVRVALGMNIGCRNHASGAEYVLGAHTTLRGPSFSPRACRISRENPEGLPLGPGGLPWRLRQRLCAI